MQERKIWFKGSLVPAAEARVEVLSPTAQFGLNVFEGIRCYWNEARQQLYAFRLQEHFARLGHSCKLIGIACPYSCEELERHLLETVRANGYRQDVAVRMTLFVDGEGSWSACEPVGMFIAPIGKARTDVATLKGMAACVSTWQRIGDNSLPPRIKAGANYINGRYAHLEARRSGYDLPLLLNAAGRVSEGAGSSLFLVRDGVLITPTLTSSVLESITRATLLQVAAETGLPAVEREVDRTELYLADEVFLCGSAVELAPIVSVDRIPVGSGKPGVRTVALLRRYHDLVSGEDASHPAWRTPVY